MTKEQAIGNIKKVITTKFNNDYSIDNVDKEAIETVLSELEKKEAIINEMSEYIDKITFVDEKEDYGCDFQLLTNVMCNHNNCKECIKEYFTNKVESEE